MKYTCVLVINFLVSVSCIAQVDTSTEAEKRYLIKMAEELALLDELAQKASEHADPDARIGFDYVTFRQDIQVRRKALENHIQKPSRSPRKLSELSVAAQ